MRQRDINRKAFSVVHYNIIAGRFKDALEPLMPIQAGDPVSNAHRSAALVDLAISMAKRFAMDNSEFDPVRFLDACSPDNEQWPLSELWPGVTESEMVDG